MHTLHPIAPTTRLRRQPLLWHWLTAAAALLFIAIVLGRVGPELHSDDYQAELAGEIVDSHVRSLQPGHMTEIASNDERDRQRNGSRPSSGLLFRFAISRTTVSPLKGGRLDVIEGRSVAVLVYEHNGRPINVFVWPLENRTVHRAQVPGRGFQWVDWRKGKMEFCAVSDAGPVDLKQLHQLMNSSA